MSKVLDFSTAYPEILILVSADFGVKGVLADEVAELLGGCGFRVKTISMSEVTTETLLDYYQLIVCVDSAYDVKLSQSVGDFIQRMVRESVDLSHMAYGIIAVNDDTMGFKNKVVDQIQSSLNGLGAVEVLEPHFMSTTVDQLQVSLVEYWSLDCVAAFSEAFAPAGDPAYE